VKLKKFGIAITTYNATEYLERVFKLIIDVKYKETFFVFIDDDSTDDTRKISHNN